MNRSANLPRSALRVVVSDAGPLIALGRLDLWHLLPALFAQVQVPSAVLTECMARPQNTDAIRIRLAVTQQWLTPCDAIPITMRALTLANVPLLRVPWKSTPVCWRTTGLRVTLAGQAQSRVPHGRGDEPPVDGEISVRDAPRAWG